MWTCASMRPGTTVRPPRSIVRTLGTLRGTLSPTEMNRPFRIVTTRATVLRLSIVWTRPLTSASVSSTAGGVGVGACAANSGPVLPAAAPMAAAVAVPKNPRREMSDMRRILLPPQTRQIPARGLGKGLCPLMAPDEERGFHACRELVETGDVGGHLLLGVPLVGQAAADEHLRQ